MPSKPKDLEALLAELLPQGEGPLFEALRYALLGGGKRLRGKLLLETTLSLGGTLEEALHPAAALEMIHAYSLIHDDLPCMDDDDVRRGKPSLHKAFGESTALLAGDLLLTLSFEVLAKAPLPPERCLSLIRLFAERAGAPQTGGVGMIEGQMLDLASEGQRVERGTLLRMHRGKTASLFIAALVGGGIAAGKGTLQELQEIGERLGLAFQFLNDLSDERGSDRANEKATALSLFGREGALTEVKRWKREVLERIGSLPWIEDRLTKFVGGLLPELESLR